MRNLRYSRDYAKIFHNIIKMWLIMQINYNKLWKLMIDKGYSKKRLCEESQITTNAMARMGRKEDVRLNTLIRICEVLHCTLDDIVEIEAKD